MGQIPQITTSETNAADLVKVGDLVVTDGCVVEHVGLFPTGKARRG